MYESIFKMNSTNDFSNPSPTKEVLVKVGIPLAVAMVTGNPFLGIITAVKCGTYGKVN
ncbi:hypothetical protein N9V02_06825 [Prochlorococcus sp. AH-736-L23]|jgi:hypothetical protein|nr:hypothetical protein [Prochlorococcus sp. AH-736-L23]|tara:strand:- start:77 stop:250 length:174 start_codon:yes stop_codon:yes gene_type:complete